MSHSHPNPQTKIQTEYYFTVCYQSQDGPYEVGAFNTIEEAEKRLKWIGHYPKQLYRFKPGDLGRGTIEAIPNGDPVLLPLPKSNS